MKETLVITTLLPKVTDTSKEIPPEKVVKSTEQVNWQALSTITYDEVLTDEALQGQGVVATIENLLISSNQLNKDIVKYLETEQVKKIPVSILTTEQTYIDGDNKYILSEDNMIVIYTLITNISSHATLQNTLNKRPNIAKETLQDILINSVTEDIGILSHTVLCRTIIKALSFIFNESIMSKNENKFEYSKNTISTVIGDMVLNTAMLINFIYEDIKQADPTYTKKILEFKKKDRTDIITMINKLKDPNNCDIEKFSIPVEILIAYLEIYCIREGIKIQTSKDEQISLKLLQKYSLQLGVNVVDWLINLGIFENTFYRNTDDKGVKTNIPGIKLKEKIHTELYVSASKYKPRISYKDIPLVYKVNYEDKVSLEIHLDKRVIPNEGNVQITPTKGLFEIIKEYNNVPHSINGGQVDDFLNILTQVLEKSTSKFYVDIDNETYAFLQLLYHINFRTLLENNPDKALVTQLIHYGLNITVFYDKGLQDKVKGNLSCETAYNILSSYKYTIIGFMYTSALITSSLISMLRPRDVR